MEERVKVRITWKKVKISLPEVCSSIRKRRSFEASTKHLWEKEKMLVTSFLFFCHYFFKAFSIRILNPLPDDKILDRSKLKQIADDI